MKIGFFSLHKQHLSCDVTNLFCIPFTRLTKLHWSKKIIFLSILECYVQSLRVAHHIKTVLVPRGRINCSLVIQINRQMQSDVVSEVYFDVELVLSKWRIYQIIIVNFHSKQDKHFFGLQTTSSLDFHQLFHTLTPLILVN